MLLATREQVLASRAAENPSPSWVRAALEDARYTPDVVPLFEKQYHLLFTYGEEQPEHPKSKMFLGEVPCSWPGYTFARYCCYRHRVGPLSHPVALDKEPSFQTNLNRALALHIRGVIVPVNPARIVLLDRYRQNGILYQRERTRILVPYYERDGVRRIHVAHNILMYKARLDYWRDHLDTGFDYPILGSFKHLFAPWNPHYHFTQQDYKTYLPPALEVNHNELLKDYEREQIDKQRTMPQVS